MMNTMVNFAYVGQRRNLIEMYTNAQSCAKMRTHDEIKLFLGNCGHAIDITMNNNYCGNVV